MPLGCRFHVLGPPEVLLFVRYLDEVLYRSSQPILQQMASMFSNSMQHDGVQVCSKALPWPYDHKTATHTRGSYHESTQSRVTSHPNGPRSGCLSSSPGEAEMRNAVSKGAFASWQSYVGAYDGKALVAYSNSLVLLYHAYSVLNGS